MKRFCSGFIVSGEPEGDYYMTRKFWKVREKGKYFGKW